MQSMKYNHSVVLLTMGSAGQVEPLQRDGHRALAEQSHLADWAQPELAVRMPAVGEVPDLQQPHHHRHLLLRHPCSTRSPARTNERQSINSLF